MVTLLGDGQFLVDRVSESYIGGEAPRIVIAVRGVERSGDRLELMASEGWVRSVRTGYHLQAGEELGKLHVVLDVSEAGVRVLRYLPSGNELLIYIGPPDGLSEG